MALVAYAASDSDSITDDEEMEVSGGVEILEKPPTAENLSAPENKGLLNLNSLPPPKPSNLNVANNLIDTEEESDEFLLKKEEPTEKPARKPIRIVAPSLIDFDSDEEDGPKEKKPKFISKASGLFSILPPPKATTLTTKSFVPNVLTKKAVPPKVAKPLVPHKVAKKITSTKISVDKEKETKDTDDEDDDIHIEEFDINTWKQVCGRKTKTTAEPIVEVIDQSFNDEMITAAPEAVKPYDGLDNEAFKKLVGSSKMRTENIRFIDINEEEVLTEENILRAKALTDPAIRVPKAEEEPLSHMSKKKHHITYLAQQAKANEQELQNRWAANRYSRKQTQAKYGF